MVQLASSFMAIWIAFAIVGGLVDGQLIVGYDASGNHTGDAENINEVTQFNITQSSSGGVWSTVTSVVTAPVKAVSATIGFIKKWANILSLNFSFLSGDYQWIRWVMLALFNGPLTLELVLRALGK